MPKASLCSPGSWKCSLLVGSALTWTLGIVIFGLSLSTIRKPVFIPSLVPLVASAYHSVVVALAGAIFICVVAVLGCCGVACKKPRLLITYSSCLVAMFIYQVVNGISLLYVKSESFPYLQFLSLDFCQYRRQLFRGRQGRQISEKDLVESITRAEANARLFNRNVALLLEEQKAKGQNMDCNPITDNFSPIAVLLFVTSVIYVYLAFCALMLSRNLRNEQNSRDSQKVRFTVQESSSKLTLSEESLQSLFGHGEATFTKGSRVDVNRTWTAAGPSIDCPLNSSPMVVPVTSMATGCAGKQRKSICSPLALPFRSPLCSGSDSVSDYLTPRKPSSVSSGSCYYTPTVPPKFPEIVISLPTP